MYTHRYKPRRAKTTRPDLSNSLAAPISNHHTDSIYHHSWPVTGDADIANPCKYGSDRQLKSTNPEGNIYAKSYTAVSC